MSKKTEKGESKPTSLSITFNVPKGVKTTGVSITPNGNIVLRGEDGVEFTPNQLTREVTHPRPKGAKVRTRQTMDGGAGAIGGLRNLSQYESVFVIDTNTRKIEGGQVSATAFICCCLEAGSGGYRVMCQEERINIYEFHGALDKPELLAILKISGDIASAQNFNRDTRIAIVTDTELGAHNDINARLRPIYGDRYLPQGFRLLYASADTGREVLNKFIRVCDRQASKHLDDLQNGDLEDAPLRVLEEDEAVKYRFGWRNARLTVENPVVSEERLQLGAKVTLYGLKRSDAHRKK